MTYFLLEIRLGEVGQTKIVYLPNNIFVKSSLTGFTYSLVASNCCEGDNINEEMCCYSVVYYPNSIYIVLTVMNFL